MAGDTGRRIGGGDKGGIGKLRMEMGRKGRGSNLRNFPSRSVAGSGSQVQSDRCRPFISSSSTFPLFIFVCGCTH
jgi:hypothetical protein